MKNYNDVTKDLINNSIIEKYLESNRLVVEKYFSLQENLIQSNTQLLSKEFLLNMIDNNQSLMMTFLEVQENGLIKLNQSNLPDIPPSIQDDRLRKTTNLTSEDEIDNHLELNKNEDSKLDKIEEWLINEMSNLTGFSKEMINADASFDSDLGLDSINMMQILVLFTETFKEFKEIIDDLRDSRSIKEIISIIKKIEVYGNQPDLKDQNTSREKPLVSDENNEKTPPGSLDISLDVINLLVAEIARLTKTREAEVIRSANFYKDLNLDIFTYQKLIENITKQFPELSILGQELLNIRNIDELKILLARFFDGNNNHPASVEETYRYLPDDKIVQQSDISDIALPKEIILVGENNAQYQYIKTQLEEIGITVVILYQDYNAWTLCDSSGNHSVEITDINGLNNLLTTYIKDQKIPSIIYLAVKEPDSKQLYDYASLSRELDLTVIGLFILAKALIINKDERDIECDIFAILGTKDNSLVFQSLRGIATTIDIEWPKVHATSIEMKCSLEEISMKNILLNIMRNRNIYDLIIEKDNIKTHSLKIAPIVPKEAQVSLNQDSVLLLTGGGSGITAEAAVMFAEKYHCKIIALGRTKYVKEEPYPGIDNGVELTKKIIEDFNKGHDQTDNNVTMNGKIIQEKVKTIKRQKSILKTAQRIKNAGGSFHYYDVDLTHEANLRLIIDSIYAAYGKINGLIHGAGIASDSMISKKSIDSFKNIYHIKAQSTINLYHIFKDKELDFAVLYSSQASYAGNLGQADYSAGNGMINMIAEIWNNEVKYPVKTILWALWKETGIAADNSILISEIKRRGLSGIMNKEGKEFLYNELLYGNKKDWYILAAPRSSVEYVETLHDKNNLSRAYIWE